MLEDFRSIKVGEDEPSDDQESSGHSDDLEY